MKIDLGGASTIGDRDTQQDCYMAYHVEESRRHLDRTLKREVYMGVLCDGMGGMGDGDFCSHAVVQAFGDAFAETTSYGSLWKQRLMMALYSANAVLFDAKMRYSALGEGSGGVLVAAAVDSNNLHYISVGDACIYLLRRRENYNGGVKSYTCEELNVKHIQWYRCDRECPKGRAVTAEEVAKSRARRESDVWFQSQPFSAVIGGEIRMADASSGKDGIRLQDGDFVILASDGVPKCLSTEDLCRMAYDRDGEEHTARMLAQDIIDEINKNSAEHKDNAACVVIKCN